MQLQRAGQGQRQSDGVASGRLRGRRENVMQPNMVRKNVLTTRARKSRTGLGLGRAGGVEEGTGKLN